MSVALAYSLPAIDPRHAHALRKKRIVAPRKETPWSEIPIHAADLQTSRDAPSNIKRWQAASLIVALLTVHAGLATYFSRHTSARPLAASKSELSIEFVKPPEPVRPKIEPPKPRPVQQKPVQTQALPQIEQPESLPTQVESSEAPVAVTPVAQVAPGAAAVETAPIGHAGYLNNPPPNYPPQAVKQGWQGTALLRVHVLATGKVDTIEIKESSGRKVLDDEAVRTVMKWLFTPSKRGDSSVDGWAVVPIEFVLDQ